MIGGIRTVTLPHTLRCIDGQIQREYPVFFKNTSSNGWRMKLLLLLTGFKHVSVGNDKMVIEKDC